MTELTDAEAIALLTAVRSSKVALGTEFLMLPYPKLMLSVAQWEVLRTLVSDKEPEWYRYSHVSAQTMAHDVSVLLDVAVTCCA